MQFVSINQYLQDIWFTITRKRILITILVLVGIYYLILPLFWPEPKITVSLQNADHGHNISSGTLSIHAWHSNISIFAVYGIFNVDKSKNNGTAVISRNLFQKIDKKRWDELHTFGINRWTWPRVYNFRLGLPIEELRNKTDSGYVTGRIYVTVRYPHVYEGFTSTSRVGHVENVKIMLSE